MTFENLVEETRRLQERFDKLNSRQWTIEAYSIELLAEAGSLADSIMIREHYREPRSRQKPLDLAGDIADVLFILANIADYYAIDIQEAYQDMLVATSEKLDRLESAPGE